MVVQKAAVASVDRSHAWSPIMNESPESPESPLSSVREKVESIVNEGGDVRGQVKSLVADAAAAAQRSGEGLVALAQTVLNGATDSLNKGLSRVPAEGTLHQVVEGLGDGLSQAVLAAKMAVEEARAQGKQFAAEDLHRVKEDLGSLTSLYVKTISDAASRTKSEASAGLSGLVDHAGNARDQVLPALKSALDAFRQDPIGLGKESVQAGVAASQHAAGTLFSAMGRLLQEAGQKLTAGSKDT
jgi:hypothetical protein